MRDRTARCCARLLDQKGGSVNSPTSELNLSHLRLDPALSAFAVSRIIFFTVDMLD